MNRKKKNAAQQRQTSRELIDIQKITEYGLLTSHGELVFFSIEPTNLSVHSPESIGSRIYALMTVLKGMAEIEMLALNSKESFEDNKRHYRQLREQEQLPVIRKLLERDMMGLDRLQVQMATAREFLSSSGLKTRRIRTSSPTSLESRKIWRTKALRPGCPAQRSVRGCWGSIWSRMRLPKNMRITTGSAGSSSMTKAPR